jgi:hypothetical protein
MPLEICRYAVSLLLPSRRRKAGIAVKHPPSMEGKPNDISAAEPRQAVSSRRSDAEKTVKVVSSGSLIP